MKEQVLLKWIAVNAIGLGFAFVAVLQMGMLLEFGFDWRMHWNWIEEPVAQDATGYVFTLLAMIVGGAILGSAQALVLRSCSIPVIRWILSAVTGFGIVAVAIDWPLTALGVLGVIPGPVEPLIITVGGGSFAGIFQYLMLNRQGIRAHKWLLLWIGGLIAGIVPTALLMISLEASGLAPSWPLEVFLNGLIIGGVAAWISGKALFAALPEARSNIRDAPSNSMQRTALRAAADAER